MPAKSVAEIAEIVRAGGGLTVNAAAVSAADLCVIAKAAGDGRARLLLVQAGRLKNPGAVPQTTGERTLWAHVAHDHLTADCAAAPDEVA
jgi:hypothetical protein